MIQTTWSFIEEFGAIPLYGIAFLFSIFRYRKYFDSVLKYLPIIIGYTFLNEILGAYIRTNDNIQIIFVDQHALNNSILFNIFDIIFFLYFFYIFWKSLKSKKHKAIIKYGSLLFIITSLINPFLQDFILYPQIYAIIAGSITLILCILLYYRQLIIDKSRLLHRNNLLFWIALGLLIFCIAYPILMIIALNYSEVYIRFNMRNIHLVLTCIMYLCFIIGFLKMRRLKPTGKE
jgi:hypothetical protein